MMMIKKTNMAAVVYHIPTTLTMLRLITVIVISLGSATSASFDSISFVLQEQNDRTTSDRRSHYKDLLITKRNLLSSHHRMKKPEMMTGYVPNSAIVSTTNHKNRLRLLDDLTIENEKDFKSFRRMTLTNSTGCVRSQNGLEVAILNAPNYSSKPTNIDICKEFIYIDASKLNIITGEQGIHVVNKFINFRCIINRNKNCIIDARQKSRHLFVNNSTLIFNRITLMNGKCGVGGSLHLTSSSLLMNKCNLASNTAHIMGGGAIFGDADSYMKLVNVNMTNNIAYSNDCDEYQNYCYDSSGGALTSFGYVQLLSVIFESNFVQGTGGAVFLLEGTLDMMNVVFTNNTALIEGGAVWASGSAKMNNAVFQSNRVNGIGLDMGGAVYSIGNIQVTNSLFANNTAKYGGGIDCFCWGADCDIINVSFVNNSAIWTGGAVSSHKNITMINVTMVNNKARTGGAMFLHNYGKITNSILHSNNAESEGGVIRVDLGSLVLHDVDITNNSAKNGVIYMFESKLDLKNNLFSNSIIDVNDSDIVAGFRNIEDVDSVYFESRLNLRPSPPPPTRMLQEKQTKQEGFVIIAAQSFPQQQTIQACVTNYKTLRKQVHICNHTLSMAPCVVNICQGRIPMNSMGGKSNSINLSNKNILINCQLSNHKNCMIDGQGLSRMFHGSNVSVTFHNIKFSNGYSLVSGGALNIQNNSFVNLFNCAFVNNSAPTGAAIMIKNTTLYVTGTLSSFINNTGNTPALVGYSSNLNLYDVLFEGNSMTKYGNGIFLLNSTVDFYNTTFSESKTTITSDFDCNVFVAINRKKFSEYGSCLDVN